jgi:hypothetical protein
MESRPTRLTPLKDILVTTGRMLIFLPARPDLRNHGALYMGAALLFSWLAGIGRYWDRTDAEWWQYLGLGSVGYIFVLATFLWLVIWPLGAQNWRFVNVLVFLGLTAPIGFLYAIPFQKFMSMDAAQLANVWLLSTISVWRVLLLFRFLQTAGRLPPFASIIGTLVPITVIVVFLAVLNLEKSIAMGMGGIEEPPASPEDGLVDVFLNLGVLAIFSAIPLLLMYGACIWFRQKAARRARQLAKAETSTLRESPAVPD